MDVQGLDRVIVATDRLEATTEQLAGLLDVDFTERSEGSSGNYYRYSSEAGIEIITPPPQGNALSEWIDRNGTGLYGITIRVRDLEVAIESLRERDIEPIDRLDTHNAIEAVYHPDTFAGILVLLRELTENEGTE